MNKAERLEKKSQAALLLAGGASAPAVAATIEMGAAAVRNWRREPEFAAAVKELREIARDRSRTPEEMVDAVSRVMDRIKGVGQPRTVVVSIPAGATPARQRRLMARGVARLLVPPGGLR